MHYCAQPAFTRAQSRPEQELCLVFKYITQVLCCSCAAHLTVRERYLQSRRWESLFTKMSNSSSKHSIIQINQWGVWGVNHDNDDNWYRENIFRIMEENIYRKGLGCKKVFTDLILFQKSDDPFVKVAQRSTIYLCCPTRAQIDISEAAVT